MVAEVLGYYGGRCFIILKGYYGGKSCPNSNEYNCGIIVSY